MNSVFQAGGALAADHPTYVERQADRDALHAALNGGYLHIIAPRQVGKTSLLKRLAARLSEMGWRSAYVDLSTLMDFPKPAWYTELGKELAHSLTPDLVPALANQVDLRHYLLDQALPWPNGQPRIALFLDEVEGAGKARDADSAPFSDTFFSMFRALYNERDKLPGTLVVALAGAVNPGDLVKDPAISPFNVGQEIDPDDFTSGETRTLTGHLANLGLPVDDAIHWAIYDWTNGHPHLTQRICAELEKAASSGSLTAITPDNVRHIVEHVILNPANPLQRDKNLRHVAKMLSGLSTPAAGLWSRLRAGESVSRNEATDDLYLELYLTGAVESEAGRLIIRNRIYEKALMEKAGTERPKVDRPESRSIAIGKPIRVFISSTWQDLQPEREAVEKALHRMQDTAFAGMEYFGSQPETPKDASLAEVDRSDVYIGIFAHRYGSGITEAEYRRARERGIPCLIYLKDDSVPVPPAHIERAPEKVAKLEALKRELKEHHTVSFFKSPDHLATQVVADLHNLLGSAPSARQEEPFQRGPKYQITITDSQGIVIGDQAQISQVFEQRRAESHVRLVSPGENVYEWGIDHYEGPVPSAMLLFLNFYLVNRGNARGSLERVTVRDATIVPSGLISLQYRGLRRGFRAHTSSKEMETPVQLSPGDQEPVSCYFRIPVGDDEPETFAERLAALSEFSITLSVSAFGQQGPLPSHDVTVRGHFGELKQGICDHWRIQGCDGLIHIVEGRKPELPSHNAEGSEPHMIRLRPLSDNIRQDLALLKDYEDALRYEDEPRRRAKYRQEIEQLRESATHYQREYSELRAWVTGEPSADMQNIATQLRQMGVKLDTLLAGQTAIHDDLGHLRQTVLDRYDTGEQTIIATITERLDQTQLTTVQAVLDALEEDRLPETEMLQVLNAVQQILVELEQRNIALPAQQPVAEAIATPTLDVKHKLKITLPIVPLLLGYEGEVQLDNGVNLETVREQLVRWVRGGE